MTQQEKQVLIAAQEIANKYQAPVQPEVKQPQYTQQPIVGQKPQPEPTTIQPVSNTTTNINQLLEQLKQANTINKQKNDILAQQNLIAQANTLAQTQQQTATQPNQPKPVKVFSYDNLMRNVSAFIEKRKQQLTPITGLTRDPLIDVNGSINKNNPEYF